MSPQAAHAGTVEFTNGVGGAGLIYEASPGEANRLKLDALGAALVATELHQVPQIVKIDDSPNRLAAVNNLTRTHCLTFLGLGVCQYLEPYFSYVRADLGDGNDTVTVTGTPTSLSGGPGNDVLTGGGDADVLVGGPGADRFHGGGQLRYNGDTVDYSASPQPVTVTIDGLANDGAATEGDLVSHDIEVIVGSSFGDRLEAGVAGSRLYGEAGADSLVGSAGNDFLAGRGGVDTFTGGGGTDDIAAVDDLAEEIDCGAGNDMVDADPIDTVAPNCERVRIR